MSKSQFVSQAFTIGQRWISEAEAELGLGIVLDIANRRLTLSFPAAGERRTYAMDNAPVSRVVYQVGEKVRHQDGTSVKITRVIEQQGCLLYHGLVFDKDKNLTKEELAIPEFELDSFVQFSTPRDRLFAGQIDKHTHFTLRYKTLNYLNQHRQSNIFGLAGPRVQLLPHQLYIANEVAQRHAPRVLLADEVGLGKTIEAGLVLHQQLISGRVKRALIVVPNSLQHQWLVEMLRRFNLAFTLLDEKRCQAIEGLDSFEESIDFIDDFTDEFERESTSDNPFESAQLILCSLDFLTKNPERYAQALQASWDLLLVDEAHHLQWSEQKVSVAYQCIEGLAKVAKGLLLLTATPEQLGLESHFARLRLLDPDRYYDLEKFIVEQKSYAPLNDLVQALLAAHVEEAKALPANLVKQLADYLPKETISELTGLAEQTCLGQAADKAISYLLDRHGTGRVLFRNTRNSVAGFPDRMLHQHSLDLTAEQLAEIRKLPLEKQLRAETFWQAQENDWWLHDPRVNWLSDLLKQNRRKKVLVICASADTAQTLEDYLRLRRGLLTAVFHEGLNLIERDRAAAYFADMEEGAQVLICSEIGSEGRNFQFAQDLVLFDLPLNPDLLEQRIGRLDRIGQTATVNIHTPFYVGSAQEKLIRWYHEGLNAFEKTCAIGQNVYIQYADNLLPILVEDDEAAFADLLQKTQTYAADLVAQLQKGRDRLLELNSCKPAQAAVLVDALAEKDEDKSLINYLDAVFDAFGIDSEKHSEHSQVIHPSDHMRVEEFPGLPESGLTITYQRQQALSREDMQFITWEHPLVRGAQELIALTEFGNTAFCTLKLPPLKPGNLMLEALYVLHCPAPAELQLFRHMPQSLLRVLLDHNGKDLNAVLGIDQLGKLLQKVPRNNAQELVRHARPALVEMLQKAEDKAKPQQADLIAAAQQKVKEEINTELDRMKALAKVNPNVRQSEIDYLQERLAASQHYLSQAKLRLDSLRVIMTV
ncbi:RNA polymerase-associated protein RapA [Cellvibrio zantedeschiae]|uniref:RNA polymerase-associated protein RapA n=1 Tax=Cellvibrio zantedeschiae TaxID=1237077 RepID=A0ABQ3AW03_9GAMM|nr:RNA polymerase-associated protein RapA [Cellvibrio zantedeschiae]GGY68249.1 RNA polymerase-associated protein RapA [Cellvibrio zantedeschiae]